MPVVARTIQVMEPVHATPGLGVDAGDPVAGPDHKPACPGAELDRTVSEAAMVKYRDIKNIEQVSRGEEGKRQR